MSMVEPEPTLSAAGFQDGSQNVDRSRLGLQYQAMKLGQNIRGTEGVGQRAAPPYQTAMFSQPQHPAVQHLSSRQFGGAASEQGEEED